MLYLWCIRVVTGDVSDLSAFSIDCLYPLSSHQCSILADITGALISCRDQQENGTHHQDEQSSSWRMYRVLLGKPGTGKSRVLITAIHHAVENEMSVLVAAPVALLAQGYHKIFLADIETDTLHGTFNIPVDAPFDDEVNCVLNKYDLVVVDEASMISAPTCNRLNLRPVVVFAGDKHQQQPLQTEGGRVTATTSIINDTYTFHSGNAIKHFLYQQFRVVDEQYGRFLDLIRYTQPTQLQLDSVQENMILCSEGDLSDNDIWQAFMSKDASTVMTVSKKGAQRINNIVVAHLCRSTSSVENTVYICGREQPHLPAQRHEGLVHRKSRQGRPHLQWAGSDHQFRSEQHDRSPPARGTEGLCLPSDPY